MSAVENPQFDLEKILDTRLDQSSLEAVTEESEEESIEQSQTSKFFEQFPNFATAVSKVIPTTGAELGTVQDYLDELEETDTVFELIAELVLVAESEEGEERKEKLTSISLQIAELLKKEVVKLRLRKEAAPDIAKRFITLALLGVEITSLLGEVVEPKKDKLEKKVAQQFTPVETKASFDYEQWVTNPDSHPKAAKEAEKATERVSTIIEAQEQAGRLPHVDKDLDEFYDFRQVNPNLKVDGTATNALEYLKHYYNQLLQHIQLLEDKIQTVVSPDDIDARKDQVDYLKAQYLQDLTDLLNEVNAAVDLTNQKEAENKSEEFERTPLIQKIEQLHTESHIDRSDPNNIKLGIAGFSEVQFADFKSRVERVRNEFEHQIQEIKNETGGNKSVLDQFMRKIGNKISEDIAHLEKIAQDEQEIRNLRAEKGAVQQKIDELTENKDNYISNPHSYTFDQIRAWHQDSVQLQTALKTVDAEIKKLESQPNPNDSQIQYLRDLQTDANELVKFFKSELADLEIGAEAKNSVELFIKEVRSLLAPDAARYQLTLHSDKLESVFSRLEATLARITTQYDGNTSIIEVFGNSSSVPEQLQAAKEELHKTDVLKTMQTIHKTLSDFEMNNRSIVTFFNQKDDIITNKAESRIADAIKNLKEMGSPLAEKLEKKNEKFMELVWARVYLYGMFDGLQKTLIGSDGQRKYIDPTSLTIGNNHYLHMFYNEHDDEFHTGEYKELTYPGEIAYNPVLFKEKVVARVGDLNVDVVPGDKIFNHRVIETNIDVPSGEKGWCRLERDADMHGLLNRFFSMMLGNGRSTAKWEIHGSNMHQADSIERLTAYSQNQALPEFLAWYKGAYGLTNKDVAALLPNTGNNSPRKKLLQHLKISENSTEWTELMDLPNDRLKIISQEHIKQTFIAELPTLDVVARKADSMDGGSDKVWYTTSGLTYPTAEAAKEQSKSNPFRRIMFASSVSFWDIFEHGLKHAEAIRDNKEGLITKVNRFVTGKEEAQSNIGQTVSTLVDHVLAEAHEELESEGKHAEAARIWHRYDHFKKGVYIPLKDRRRYLKESADNIKIVNPRKAPQWIGFHVPSQHMVMMKGANEKVQGNDRYLPIRIKDNDGLDGKILTRFELVDQFNMPLSEAFNEDTIYGGINEHYSNGAPNIDRAYDIINAEVTSLGSGLEAIGANTKTFFYAAPFLPDELGSEIFVKAEYPVLGKGDTPLVDASGDVIMEAINPEVESQIITEQLLLADALYLIMHGDVKSIHDIESKIRNTRLNVDPLSQELIVQICTRLFGHRLLMQEYWHSITDQFVNILKYT